MMDTVYVQYFSFILCFSKITELTILVSFRTQFLGCVCVSSIDTWLNLAATVVSMPGSLLNGVAKMYIKKT